MSASGPVARADTFDPIPRLQGKYLPARKGSVKGRTLVRLRGHGPQGDEQGDEVERGEDRHRPRRTSGAPPCGSPSTAIVVTRRTTRPVSPTMKPIPSQAGSSGNPPSTRSMSGEAHQHPRREHDGDERPERRPGGRARESTALLAASAAAATAPTSVIAPRTCRKSGRFQLSGRTSASIRRPASRSSARGSRARAIPLPQVSARPTGSRSFAWSSALGASPSPARRSASFRASPGTGRRRSRPGHLRRPRARARHDPRVAPVVADVVHEPQAEAEGHPHPEADRRRRPTSSGPSSVAISLGRSRRIAATLKIAANTAPPTEGTRR